MARVTIPGAVGISRQSYRELDTLINSLQTGSRQHMLAMNAATRLLAHTTQGFAMKMMTGPGYPSGSAWTIPVRMITGRSRRGWKVRQVYLGAYEVFNEERGAWMVEHGISRGGRGVRRPILRNAGVETLRFIQTTGFGTRMMADTFGNLRNNRGQFRSFEARIRPFMLMASGRTVAGPSGRLP